MSEDDCGTMDFIVTKRKVRENGEESYQLDMMDGDLARAAQDATGNYSILIHCYLRIEVSRQGEVLGG